jgi:hypothetical protein
MATRRRRPTRPAKKPIGKPGVQRRLEAIERAVRENTKAILAERHDIGRVASALAVLKTAIDDLAASLKPGPAVALRLIPGPVTEQRS